MAVETTTPPGTASGHELGARARARRWAGEPATLAVIGLTVLGGVLRVVVARQSVFADELSTYWISVTHGLGGVLKLLYSSGRIQHAEITPPLSFVASWLTTRAGSSPELLRLPALLAGTATIPLVYAVGLRTVGRRAGVVAAALTTLSPFMIYYSAEARAYGLLMFLVLGSTMAMLLAVDTGRRRYWILYALCSAAAFYTHYTCVFVLGAQLLWLLWTQPGLRRQGLLANVGAALLVVPWIPGLIADERSPTLKILSGLSAFSVHAVRLDLEHWAIGYPYAQLVVPNSTDTGLRQLPGVPALFLLALAGVVAAVGLARRWAASRANTGPARGVVLVIVLALATPVGECVFSAVGDHIIGVRDMAASWPFFALSIGALFAAAGRRVGVVAGALGVAAFAIGASKMLVPRFERPNYQAVAAYVAARASARDVTIDETGPLVTPGPLTGFDVAFHGRSTVVRALVPVERDHPFNVFDHSVSLPAAERQAVRRAAGARIFVIAPTVPPALPGGYRLVAVRRYAGIEQLLVSVWSR
jgi:4-amino-4-deoxy-L-arabinose transferase-like glycosyltransferase